MKAAQEQQIQQNADVENLHSENTKLSCIDAAQTFLNINKYPSKNAQAFFFQRDSGFCRKTFIQEQFGSHAGKSRAKACIMSDYNPGRCGPHQHLNDEDEKVLEYWVLALISSRRIVYPSTLMELV